MSYEGNLNLAERVRELERELEETREAVRILQGELRGAGEWLAKRRELDVKIAQGFAEMASL